MKNSLATSRLANKSRTAHFWRVASIILLLALFIVVPVSSHPEQPSDWQTVGQEGQGKLLSTRGQRVLVLKGTPYEIGFQHGKLLAKEAAQDAKAYLDDWAIGKRGESRSSLSKIFESLRPFIPERYMEEMKGLADGSGVPLEEIHLLHAIPTRFHCTGAAAFGKATADGYLYHTRSLDYSLDVGSQKTAQENAALIVFQPEEGNAHAVLSWAGLIGCVSGMNAKGISIGEIGNACRDESYSGMPMIFMLREALRTCESLDEVINFIGKAPRTCGFTFVVGDGKIPSASALEVSHSRMAVGRPGDPKSDPPPHSPITDAVRRGNYFVDREMAAVQRDEYDPRISAPEHWLGYSVMSGFLVENLGRLNDIKMIELLRKYPPEHPCLHQAVFCPSTLELWVSNAVSPAKAKFAGAQNQPFYKYNLAKLIEGIPFEVIVAEPPARSTGVLPRPETGTTTISEKEEFISDGSLSPFRLKKKNFDWVLTYDSATDKYFVADLSFPSEVETPWLEVNTVLAEYYLPRSTEKMPGVIVLDILEGNFVVARTLARTLADNGIAALPLHLPFFGKRRPRNGPEEAMISGEIDLTCRLMTQAVLDIRCAAQWLRTRKEIDAGKTGIVGVSLGAITGALAIGVDGGFTKNALVLGGGDIAQIVWTSPETVKVREQLIEKGYTLEKLREELRPVDPLTYAHRIKPSTVMMFNAKNDQTVLPDCTTKLWQKAGQPKIVWYNTSHVGAAMYMNKILEEIIAFVRE